MHLYFLALYPQTQHSREVRQLPVVRTTANVGYVYCLKRGLISLWKGRKNAIWLKRELNRRPRGYECSALPLCYSNASIGKEKWDINLRKTWCSNIARRSIRHTPWQGSWTNDSVALDIPSHCSPDFDTEYPEPTYINIRKFQALHNKKRLQTIQQPVGNMMAFKILSADKRSLKKQNYSERQLNDSSRICPRPLITLLPLRQQKLALCAAKYCLLVYEHGCTVTLCNQYQTKRFAHNTFVAAKPWYSAPYAFY